MNASAQSVMSMKRMLIVGMSDLTPLCKNGTDVALRRREQRDVMRLRPLSMQATCVALAHAGRRRHLSSRAVGSPRLFAMVA